MRQVKCSRFFLWI